MNYTKGEWKAFRTELGGVYKFRVETDKNILAGVYSEANAQLIASAPDMHKTLKHTRVMLLNMTEDRVGLNQQQVLLLAETEQALAKAGGE